MGQVYTQQNYLRYSLNSFTITLVSNLLPNFQYTHQSKEVFFVLVAICGEFVVCLFVLLKLQRGREKEIEGELVRVVWRSEEAVTSRMRKLSCRES